MAIISIKDLSFRYPGTKNYILNSFSWQKDQAGSIGLLGKNGSGKTTLLRLLTGNLTPNHGSILLDQGEIKKFKQKGKITYVPENARLFLIGPTPKKDLSRIINEQKIVNALLDKYSLNSIADKKLYHLSEGQRRLIALFIAFQIPSRLLLIDEPTIGLDFRGRNLLFQLLSQAKQQRKLVIVSTNDARIFPKLDELLIIQNGSPFLQGTPQEILFKLEKNTELIPNQIVRLITFLEEKTGKKIPHSLTSGEFNQFLIDGKVF
ncbi:MAG: ATP-binding cassette domain-containing protein [Promethearchaeota archaeon]